MRPFLLLLAGFGCVAAPAVAQTVVLPSAQTASTIAREKAVKDAIAEAALVNKMTAINGANDGDVLGFDTRARKVRGTPFLFPGWAMGDAQLSTSAKPMAGVFKFDAYNQQLRALRSQGDSIILTPEKLQGFTLRPTGSDGKPMERHFELLPSSLVPDVPVAYAEDLSMGKELRLLKFQRKTVFSEKPDPAYSSGAPTDAYQTATQYYLRWADGTYVPVKGNKASILATIAQRQATAVTAEAQDKSKARTDAEVGALVQRIDARLAAK
ncbi:hypothetical protein [Hymenobacter segetis]|uniref:Uncharacterized protein n=1 Tax=Hymenobacter segetis TaxID=2025509 RepID=A0ABU9LS71_9BACT